MKLFLHCQRIPSLGKKCSELSYFADAIERSVEGFHKMVNQMYHTRPAKVTIYSDYNYNQKFCKT